MARITNAQWALLTAAEADLVRATEDRVLRTMTDEDELLALHDRVRRARNKFSKLFRRQAASTVASRGGRGAARATNARTAEKAEIFEDALSRVSRRLASVSHQAALDLRAQRLAAARGTSAAPRKGAAAAARKAPAAGSATSTAGRRRSGGAAPKTAKAKRDASTRATGARRQAARDGR